ncbi:uncharacterized protein LOC122023830 [Zingiber officinale]|uniref:uncharacterized protein LOC122023830 n=1 Tax=Zingiber officinale TaxID=94328 RepID=UPI001C4BE3B7|nr:uncharacterized protein LOC122023830 [Zingiber officinale]
MVFFFLSVWHARKMKCSSDHHFSSDGMNTGASMAVHYRRCRPVESSLARSHCCCVNMYVNNNVQGVTNSVLFGSKVKIEDACTRLAFAQFNSSKGNKDRGDDGLRTEMKKLMLMMRIVLLFLSSGLIGIILLCSFSGKFKM